VCTKIDNDPFINFCTHCIGLWTIFTETIFVENFWSFFCSRFWWFLNICGLKIRQKPAKFFMSFIHKWPLFYPSFIQGVRIQGRVRNRPSSFAQKWIKSENPKKRLTRPKKHQKSVARPILARPLLQKMISGPSLYATPCMSIFVTRPYTKNYFTLPEFRALEGPSIAGRCSILYS